MYNTVQKCTTLVFTVKTKIVVVDSELNNNYSNLEEYAFWDVYKDEDRGGYLEIKSLFMYFLFLLNTHAITETDKEQAGFILSSAQAERCTLQMTASCSYPIDAHCTKVYNSVQHCTTVYNTVQRCTIL